MTYLYGVAWIFGLGAFIMGWDSILEIATREPGWKKKSFYKYKFEEKHVARHKKWVIGCWIVTVATFTAVIPFHFEEVDYPTAFLIIGFFTSIFYAATYHRNRPSPPRQLKDPADIKNRKKAKTGTSS